jgi:hypothetical protein
MIADSLFRDIRIGGPMMGRDFTAADNIPGAGKVAIIGYGIWQRLRRRSQHHRQGPPHQGKPVWC